MFTNNNLNHIETKEDDINDSLYENKYWNNFEKKILTPLNLPNIDVYDCKEWLREEIEEIFNLYKEKWIEKEYKNINPIELIQKIIVNFEFNSTLELLDDDRLSNKFRENINYITKIIKIMYKMTLNKDGERITKEEWETYSPELRNKKYYIEEFQKFHDIYDNMMEIIYYCQETLTFMSRIIEAFNPNHDSRTRRNSVQGLLRKWTGREEEKEKDHQKLLVALFEICLSKNYSKYKNLIYRPVYTSERYYTMSCTKVEEIDVFVYNQTSRDKNPMLFDLATKDKGTMNFIKEHLKNCCDNSLPELKKDRSLYSFNNGIYKLNIKEEKKTDKNEIEFEYKEKFYPYDKNQRPNCDNGVVSCKYFDKELNMKDYNDWYDIPTDNIQKILDLQFENEKEHEAICRWMYIMMGRLLYPVGEMDDWQVICFMKGLAGTGKGTITKTSQQFYDPEDVGVLGNDAEKTFGLSAIYDKLLFVAPEIKDDISLPQASFQSMISGEDVNVPIKHKTAESITWKTPGILAGNDVPNWTDNSGSIARRLMIFAFLKKVPQSQLDPFLWKKIKNNIPNILRKCNLAYLEAINHYAKRNIWDILPSYFRFRREELSEKTNPLKQFLKSPGIIYKPNCYISEDELKNIFMDYLKDNRQNYNYSIDKLNEPFQTIEEQYPTELKLVKIDRRKKSHRDLCKNNETYSKYNDRKGYWIRGMTIQDETTSEIPEDEIFVNYLKEIEKLD